MTYDGPPYYPREFDTGECEAENRGLLDDCDACPFAEVCWHEAAYCEPQSDLRSFDAQWTPDDLEAYAQEQADQDDNYVSDNDILEASQ